MAMKIKFVVMNRKWSKEVARFDTYEEAEQKIEQKIQETAKDILGAVEFYILKIWTNEK